MTTITITTNKGKIVAELDAEKAPKTVANFMQYVNSGFYKDTIFHRVINRFMIQGGDPNTKDSLKKETFGQGGPGHTVKAEFSDLPHKRGIVSMARASDPDSAGSQFFIVVEDSRFLDRKYTVFDNGHAATGLTTITYDAYDGNKTTAWSVSVPADWPNELRRDRFSWDRLIPFVIDVAERAMVERGDDCLAVAGRDAGDGDYRR